MNTTDILRSGHQTVLDAVASFPEEGWQQPGACGDWTARDILAHLASFEAVLVDILRRLSDDEADTPALASFLADFKGFNEREVQARRGKTTRAVIDEYKAHHADVIRLIAEVPTDKLRQNGLLAWYGDNYDLEDFLVYTFYGHKREHCAQILMQRDQLLRQANTGRG